MAKKNAKQRRKEAKGESAQSFLPIRDIRNGMVETTDGRYLKILEIEPINFALRSSEEQFNIISSFASWLKISPVRLQCKTITRRADSDKHISLVKEELAQEENPQCRALGEDYLRLIQDVGSREALTRRFFLIFQYEAVGRDDGDYSKIYSALQGAEQTARAYFLQCGNGIVQPANPDEATAEILYQIFNRRSCQTEPFQTRVDRVVLDTMASQGLTLGLDPVPEIPVVEFLAPRGIDFTHYNHIIMDGGTTPSCTSGETATPAGCGPDGCPPLSTPARASTSTSTCAGRTAAGPSTRWPSASASTAPSSRGCRTPAPTTRSWQIPSRQAISSKTASPITTRTCYYLSVFITVSAQTYEELLWRKRQMTDMLKSMDMQVSECNFQQEAALRSVLPFLHRPWFGEKVPAERAHQRGGFHLPLLQFRDVGRQRGAAGGQPEQQLPVHCGFVQQQGPQERQPGAPGHLRGGEDLYHAAAGPADADARHPKLYCGAHQGPRVPPGLQPHRRGVHQNRPGSPHCINVMEIRHVTSPEMELIDEIAYGEMDSLLARKIQQLMTFFGLLIPDMTNEEEQMLDEALIKTYQDFGITHDNDSVYGDKSHFPPKMKKMPVLGDLHKHLLENPMTQRLAAIVSRFVTGSAQSFNRQTNVDLSNKYIVLDLSELKGKLLPVGMFIALDYVWDQIKADRTQRKAIFIDEIWQLIGASSTRMAAEFCLEIFKVIRGFGGAAVAATQDLSDFFGLEDGKYGRAIINNSKNKIILNLEPDEARTVQETLKLTRSEVRAITQFERGEALICSNSNKVPVVIKASQTELEMITTDRAELEALLLERKKTRKEGKARKIEKTQREEVETSPSSLPDYTSDSKKGRT